VSHVAADDDVDAFHADATTGGGIAVDDQQTTMSGGTGCRTCIAAHMHEAGHHVLGDAVSGVTLNDDGGTLIHAGTVITDVTGDLYPRRCVGTNGQGVLPPGVQHAPHCVVGIRGQRVQLFVQLADRGGCEVDRFGAHAARSQT
jgi:hypothetical protein